MAPTAWGAITAKAYRCNWKNRTSGNYPAVEKPGAWRPWKSLRDFHFPTAPPPHQSLPPKPKPDISCATKTGHFNLLTTGNEESSPKKRDSCSVRSWTYLLTFT